MLRSALRLVVGLAGLAAPSAAAGAEPPPRPDIVLITIDTLRPDALGWIGGTNATPAIDAIAASGFRFPSAIAPAPLTLPSHVSMMTGLTPPRHGVRDNGRLLAASGPETLAERLAGAGYTTAAFVSGFPLSSRFGLDRGFGQYDDRFEARPHQGGELERSAKATADAALGWLAETPGPRFVWVHFYDPHDPYSGRPVGTFDSAAQMRRAYDAEVRAVDDAVARLRAALPAGERTLTILTADHGESLGEHGETTHGFFVYQSTIEVPLVIAWPGRIPAGQSRSRVGLVDLAPTVLALLDLPPWADRDGRSLEPVLRGGAPPARAVLAESRRPWHSYGWAPLEAVIEGSWKLIAAPRPELYDLDSDPDETVNLYPTQRDVARRLARLRPERPAQESAALEDPGTLAQLAALGYLGGSGAGRGEPGRGLPDPKDRIDVWNRLGRAEAALERGEPAAARIEFDRVLAVEPDNPFALGRSAAALLALGEAATAEERLRRALRLAPDQAEIRQLLTELLQQQRRFAEAAQQWMELARLQPRDPAVWRGLGGTLGLSGRPEEAVQAFERAVELAPTSGETWTRLAFAAVAAGQRERAIDSLQAAARHTDSGRFAHAAALGILLDDAGRPDEAATWLARSVSVDPDFAEARLRLARLRARSGQVEEARAELRQALASDPALAARAAADPLLAPLH